MRKINNQTIFLALYVLCTASVYALDELGVVGQVTEAEPYYTKFINKASSKSMTLNSVQQPSKAMSRKYLKRIYSYDSGLTAGKFQRYYHGLDTKYAYQTPICLIANDVLSIEWLKTKTAALKKANAVCYLVRNEQGEAEALQKKYPELKILTVNPRYLIQLAKIPHYPAVVSKKGVEQ